MGKGVAFPPGVSPLPPAQDIIKIIKTAIFLSFLFLRPRVAVGEYDPPFFYCPYISPPPHFSFTMWKKKEGIWGPPFFLPPAEGKPRSGFPFFACCLSSTPPFPPFPHKGYDRAFSSTARLKRQRYFSPDSVFPPSLFFLAKRYSSLTKSKEKGEEKGFLLSVVFFPPPSGKAEIDHFSPLFSPRTRKMILFFLWPFFSSGSGRWDHDHLFISFLAGQGG